MRAANVNSSARTRWKKKAGIINKFISWRVARDADVTRPRHLASLSFSRALKLFGSSEENKIAKFVNDR